MSPSGALRRVALWRICRRSTTGRPTGRSRWTLLRPSDPPSPFPWSSQLEGELRELRCHYGPELVPGDLPPLAQPVSCCCTCSARTPAGCRRRNCRSRVNGGTTFGRGWMRSGGGRRGRPGTTPRELVSALINSGKMRSIVPARKDVVKVAQTKRRSVSPTGSTAAEGARRRARRSPGYREARARLAPYEQLARIVIRRRMELELTQEQLAERMGTSHSAISRVESGQHATSVQTLQRLADALEMRFVMGFEHGPADKPVRELVPA